MRTTEFEIRCARPSDADDLAAAHIDSIHSIGALFYEADVVNDWSAGLRGDIYVKAMERGEVFYIAVGKTDGKSEVLGFSSYRVEQNEHRTAIYVRAGANSIRVDASLAAIQFYKANGFDEVGRGEHRLWSGRPMPCVFMRKILAAA